MYDDFLTGYEVYGDVEPEYENERWSKLDEFDGEHYVSDMGRVCHVDSHYEEGYKFMRNNNLINGYAEVSFYKNGKKYRRTIHRLVAEHFIPNPDNLPLVRHLNDIKTDNRVENLAWGTYSDNMWDRIKNGRHEKRQLPIILIDCRTGEGIYFDSCMEASRYLGYELNVVYTILKRNQTIKAHRVIRASDIDLPKDIKNGDHLKQNFGKSTFRVKNYPVKAYNINTGEEIIFENSKEAWEYFGVPFDSMGNYINQHKKLHRTWELSKIIKEEIYENTEFSNII